MEVIESMQKFKAVMSSPVTHGLLALVGLVVAVVALFI
jgi:hypothetical protein